MNQRARLDAPCRVRLTRNSLFCDPSRPRCGTRSCGSGAVRLKSAPGTTCRHHSLPACSMMAPRPPSCFLQDALPLLFSHCGSSIYRRKYRASHSRRGASGHGLLGLACSRLSEERENEQPGASRSPACYRLPAYFGPFLHSSCTPRLPSHPTQPAIVGDVPVWKPLRKRRCTSFRCFMRPVPVVFRRIAFWPHWSAELNGKRDSG